LESLLAPHRINPSDSDPIHIMGGMADENFAEVEWNQNHAQDIPSAPPGDDIHPGGLGKRKNSSIAAMKSTQGSSDKLQAGRNADAIDLAGVGHSTMECTVTHPLKENDGSKDAYVSYEVITRVCIFYTFPQLVLIIDHRPTSLASPNLSLLFAGDLPTLYFCTIN